MSQQNEREQTMTDVTPLAGVLPVVQTPFGSDGEIDTGALRAEVDWAIDQGVAGMTTGMVSEILRLSDADRDALTRVVCEATASRGRLSVIGCGAESTHGALRHARHAQECGADALMVNPPVTVALPDAQLRAYYGALIEAVDVPVVVQDASGYIGRPLSIEVQREILDDYGDRVYFKPEAAPIGPRLTMLREATGGRARVIEGTGGGALIDSFRRGIVGTMPGTEVCWAIQRIWDLLTGGRWEEAYRIGGPLSALVSLQTSIDVFVAVEKHLLVRQGVLTSAAVREPRGFELDAETVAEVDRLVDQISEACRASLDRDAATHVVGAR